MIERRSLAKSIVDLGTRAFDILGKISYQKREIEPEIDKLLTNALLLFALNNPNPGEPALVINGRELTSRDLANEVADRTKTGQLALRLLRKQVRREGLAQVVQALIDPDQDASKLVEQWQTE